MGVQSFIKNIKEGNKLAAVLDGIGVLADTAAVLLPCVPGGAGAALKGIKALNKADNITDGLKAADKVTDTVSAINKVEDTSSLAKSVIKTDFYVKPNGDVIPSTGYRALNESGAKYAKNGDIMSPSGTTYFSFDDMAGKSAEEIKSTMQLFDVPVNYAEFNTLQIIDDINIPNAYGNKLKNETFRTYEPLTNSYPEQGIGGATQVTTSSNIDNYDLKDIQ